MNYFIKTIIGSCFILLCSLVQAQVDKGTLVLKETISSTISAKEKHQYKVSLTLDQFTFFRIMQQGIDLQITTYDPQGMKLEDYDSPNGRYGPEAVSFVSSESGIYTLEIYPLQEDDITGQYTITWEKLEPKATSADAQVDQLFAAWDNQQTPGAAVAIVKDDFIIYQKGYGMANLEYDIPIDASTSIFHIASVSKQFTAFSILLLEQEGKLSIDDDIRKYLPEVPDFGKTITLRHLASHTSGLRDQWNLLALAGWRLDDVITKAHVLKLIGRQNALNFNPRDEFLYCNSGFTLLAEVVARVSGMSFAQFTQEHIFEPLHMEHTLFYDDHEKIVKNRVYSYYSDSTGFKKSVLSYANVGATSLFTTVEDLSRWAQNFYQFKIGSAAMMEVMNTPVILNDFSTFGGALGQFVSSYKGLKEISHGGADAGYRSFLTRFPEQHFSVSVFSNVADFNSAGIAHKIADIYLKDQLEKKSTSKDSIPLVNDEKVIVPENSLTNYLGDYELTPGFILSITRDQALLFVQATGQPKFKLNPVSETLFTLEEVDAKIEFVPNGVEAVQLIKLHQGGKVMDATKMEAFDKKTVDLSEVCGDYFSDELETTYHFVLDDGKLIAKHIRNEDIELSPVKEDLFSGNAWFFGNIEIIRNDKHEVTGCKISSGRVRNVVFKRIG